MKFATLKNWLPEFEVGGGIYVVLPLKPLEPCSFDILALHYILVSPPDRGLVALP